MPSLEHLCDPGSPRHVPGGERPLPWVSLPERYFVDKSSGHGVVEQNLRTDVPSTEKSWLSHQGSHEW